MSATENTNSLMTNYFLIPKTWLFTFISTIVLTFSGMYIILVNDINKIEKQLAIVNVKMEIQQELMERHTNKLKKIDIQLNEIEKSILLKQDKILIENNTKKLNEMEQRILEIEKKLLLKKDREFK